MALATVLVSDAAFAIQLHPSRRMLFSQAYAHFRARLRSSPTRVLVASIFSFCLFTGLLYVRSISSRDPGSWFFDPETAYAREYSIVRQEQAERFIEAASTAPPFHSNTTQASLCIGVPSIARDGARYLRTTVGSLLAGLTSDERDEIHLIVFIAHTDPTMHPAYQETWLANLADEILRYDVSQEELDRLKDLESMAGLYSEKGLSDYIYLSKRCYDTGAPYVAIIEDDVIALDGWYHRTAAGIRQVETYSAAEKESKDFLYLRLFYTEEYLGWNKEDWSTYVFWSLVAFVACVGLTYVVRSCFPDTTRFLTPWSSIGVCLVLVPLLIALFFAAGKATVLPLSSGVSKMNNYGCCAQGLLYPRNKVYELMQWFKKSGSGFADMLVEQYANEHGGQRWALTPSVLQHVGAKSSKTDDSDSDVSGSRRIAPAIWNFAFEMNDATALQQEHQLAALDLAKQL